MKTTVKKPLWFTVIPILCFVVVTLLAVNGCNQSETSKLDTDNPLTDLPWLKVKVDEITSQSHANPLYIAIYQCTYGDGKIGFLEERGTIAYFYNYEGEILCLMGGIIVTPCQEELKIDFANKKLIWEINNNPQESCHCIIDTLKGEWIWIKTYTPKLGIIDSDFKSIVKILSQNDDTSFINYEVFVADTLFSKGNFQIQQDQWRDGRANINLPHWSPSLQVDELWIFSFGDEIMGKSKDILCFWRGDDDECFYYYQKIK